MTSAASLAFALAALAAVAGGIHLRAEAREAAARAAHPPAGTILDIDGTPVHAVTMGRGPDVVLIHGAGGSLRDFTFDLAPRLAADYRVTAVDRPGHGYTGRMGGDGESPRAQARLLQAAARRLDLGPAIVVGHSFGGAVAMAWALEDPGLTAGLVLLAGATMPWPGGLDASYHVNASALGAALVVPAITALLPEAYARRVVAGVFAPQPVPEGYADHLGLLMSMRRDVLRANAAQVTALRPHVVEMSARYPTLDMPAELIHGDADTIVPADIHSRPLAALLPQARLTLLEGIGHMPHHAAPAATVAAIDRAAVAAGLR